MKVCVLLVTLVAATAAAGRSYLPPSAQYGAPAARGAGFFSSQRSSPSRGLAAGSRRSSQYGAPSRRVSVGGLSTKYGVPGYGYGRAGMQEDPLAEPANYQFSYAVQDANSLTDFAQEETRQEESAQGQYRVLLPDGRKQIVTYQADDGGYRPTIEYQETGITAYSAGGNGYGRGRSGAGNGGYQY